MCHTYRCRRESGVEFQYTSLLDTPCPSACLVVKPQGAHFPFLLLLSVHFSARLPSATFIRLHPFTHRKGLAVQHGAWHCEQSGTGC